MAEYVEGAGPAGDDGPPASDDGLRPARANTRALIVFLIVVISLATLAVFIVFAARSNMQAEVSQQDVMFDFAPQGRRLADRPIEREAVGVEAPTPGQAVQRPNDDRRARVEEALAQIEEMRRLAAAEAAAESARLKAEREADEREAAREAYEVRRRAGVVVYSSAESSSRDRDAGGGGDDLSALFGQIAQIGDAAVARGDAGAGAQRAGGFGLASQLGSVGGSVEVVEAAWRGDQSTRMTQGAVIPGVLETAISSEGPGAVRAVVAMDVYSTDGNRLLVPRGTRLFGQHASSVQQGATRVGIIWTRLQRPDGVDALIRSPGTDAIGIAGIDGLVKRHFWQRFGAAMIFSLVEVAQNRTDNRDAAVMVQDGGRVGEEIIRQTVDIPPTILVPQGKQINVMLANDVDFSAVLQQGYSY